MVARWYLLFDGGFPKFLVPLSEMLGLSWSIVKNTTEGSTGPADAARNKYRERFVLLFPEDLDGLPNLAQEEEPPMYTDQCAEDKRKATTKRNIFDSISMFSVSSRNYTGSSGMMLMVGENLDHQSIRHGLVELFNSVFTYRTLKTVVQTRTTRQDKSLEDHSKLRGVEVTLRSVEFEGVTNIEEKLLELTRQGTSRLFFNLMVGVVWAKYGLWTSKTLSAEENLKRGQWIIFGAWPETLKRILSFCARLMPSYDEERWSD